MSVIIWTNTTTDFRMERIRIVTKITSPNQMPISLCPHPSPLPKGEGVLLPSPFRRGAGGEVEMGTYSGSDPYEDSLIRLILKSVVVFLAETMTNA